MSAATECPSAVARIELSSQKAKSKTLDLSTSAKMVSAMSMASNGAGGKTSNGHRKEHHHSGGSDSNDTISSGSTASKLSKVSKVAGSNLVAARWRVEIWDI